MKIPHGRMIINGINNSYGIINKQTTQFYLYLPDYQS